jgi:hypothetical protein
MKTGDRVKLKFGGGHVGVVTEKIEEFQVSYPIDGKPAAGRFRKHELELTEEEPEPREFIGFKRMEDD